jgi:hypothetical protein
VLHVSSITATPASETWSVRTVRIARTLWLTGVAVLLALLFSLLGLWLAGRSSTPSPSPTLSGKVSALYPDEHYGCFSTSTGKSCGAVFSQVPLRLGETVRIARITISQGGETLTAFVVVRPLLT